MRRKGPKLFSAAAALLLCHSSTFLPHHKAPLYATGLSSTQPLSSQSSLWVSSTAGGDIVGDASGGARGLEGIRVGANVFNTWVKGFGTRLQLSADASGARVPDSVKAGDTADLKFRKPGGDGSHFLSRFCEAFELTGEAIADGGQRRLHTIVCFDAVSGKSRILCAAAQGNHEIQTQLCPPHEGTPAGLTVSSSHLFQRGERFVKIQPAHDFTANSSQLRVQGGTIPKQTKNEQWTEVDFLVSRQHPVKAWDAVIGLRQNFDGGRISLAPYLRLRDRSLRYEYSHSLSKGGLLKAALEPSNMLRVQWKDPSESRGYWLTQLQIPLHKGATLRDGSIAFRREWAF
ncbi:transmembrane protein [Cystoisospora suis]|uniref:Transmembrane protein n=1 Tax=Cystoisospora suis TaxID=483139 RepID=A0A2C6KPX7_9APIC|nr:transmembrane protein [Cystoisospora suis]